MQVNDREVKIYEILRKLQEGNYEDRSFAFDCIGYLVNESIEDSLETRLNVLESKIRDYSEKK